jgi:hypothetical protein
MYQSMLQMVRDDERRQWHRSAPSTFTTTVMPNNPSAGSNSNMDMPMGLSLSWRNEFDRLGINEIICIITAFDSEVKSHTLSLSPTSPSSSSSSSPSLSLSAAAMDAVEASAAKLDAISLHRVLQRISASLTASRSLTIGDIRYVHHYIHIICHTQGSSPDPKVLISSNTFGSGDIIILTPSPEPSGSL